MALHEAPEEPVSKDEDLLAAVERLAEAEEFHLWVEAGDDPVDGLVEDLRRIEGERDRLI